MTLSETPGVWPGPVSSLVEFIRLATPIRYERVPCPPILSTSSIPPTYWPSISPPFIEALGAPYETLDAIQHGTPSTPSSSSSDTTRLLLSYDVDGPARIGSSLISVPGREAPSRETRMLLHGCRPPSLSHSIDLELARTLTPTNAATAPSETCEHHWEHQGARGHVRASRNNRLRIILSNKPYFSISGIYSHFS